MMQDSSHRHTWLNKEIIVAQVFLKVVLIVF
jgi:hypothetical protein